MARPPTRQLLFSLLATVVLVAVIALVITSVIRDPGHSGTFGPPSSWNAQVRQRVKQVHQQAMDLMDKKQFDLAFQVLNDHLEKFPLDPTAHSLLARLHLARNQPDLALDQARQSLQLDPDQPDMLMFAAALEMKRGRLEQAIADYENAERLEPSAPQYPLWLANAYLKAGRNDPARLAALRTLRLAPRQHQAYAILAEVSARQNHLPQALEQIDKALALCKPQDPAHLKYLLRKAVWLRRSNQPGRALELLKTLDPDQRTSLEVGQQLAQTYLMLSRPLLAAQTWAAVYQAHPSALPAAEAGLCFVRAGQLDQARQYYILAGSHMPLHPKVQALKQALEQAADSAPAP